MLARLLKTIDSFLNNITMYRLVLCVLIGLLLVATIFSFLKVLPFDPFSLIFSTLFFVVVCLVTNFIFAKAFHAQTNIESAYISALILALIITPMRAFSDLSFLFWVGALAMASKYIIAINKKHIFNPAAFAVVLTSFTINQSASWWVGTVSMLPFVLIGGALVVRKIRKISMFLTFLIVAILAVLVFGLSQNLNLLTLIKTVIFDSPILFFALIMLTEPLTTPPTRNLQLLCGGLVGLLFAPQTHLGSVYLTPELALLVGNIFSYLVSPKEKLVLKLKEIAPLAPNIYDFIFDLPKRINFLPGQYMEWTLAHGKPDSRGNRRYFTLASSPTEDTLRIGVRFSEKSSSFKQSLLALKKGDEIVVSQLAGDFVLPKSKDQKLVFIAGGIGITPFRSMIKYLEDNNQKRPIILFYSNKSTQDIVYQDIFSKAEKDLGIKVVNTITDTTQVPKNWQGKIGRIDEKMIKEEVTDYKERLFYLSGPSQMVSAFEQTLKSMGIDKKQIITDFFPGY